MLQLRIIPIKVAFLVAAYELPETICSTDRSQIIYKDLCLCELMDDDELYTRHHLYMLDEWNIIVAIM